MTYLITTFSTTAVKPIVYKRFVNVKHQTLLRNSSRAKISVKFVEESITLYRANKKRIDDYLLHKFCRGSVSATNESVYSTQLELNQEADLEYI